MRRLREHLVRRLLDLIHHFVVAIVDEVFEAGYFKDVLGVCLVLFILIGCQAQKFFLEHRLGSWSHSFVLFSPRSGLISQYRLLLHFNLSVARMNLVLLVPP